MDVDTFNGNSSFMTNSNTKIYESLVALTQINNSETADRKIIFLDENNNEINTLYLHTEQFNIYSNLFIDNPENTIKLNIRQDLPLMDLIIFIYTRDIKKLKKYFKINRLFFDLFFVSLKLNMNIQFFQKIISNIDFLWEEIFFKNKNLWSIETFDIKILILFIESPSFKINNFKNMKLKGILYWLNNFNVHHDENTFLKNLFMIKEYIINFDLMLNLNLNEIDELSNLFKEISICFDFEKLFNENIFIKYKCLICDKIYKNIYEVDFISDNICKSELFHPICNKIVNLNFHQNKFNGKLKDSCNYCHKTKNSRGCIYNDNKHIFYLYN